MAKRKPKTEPAVDPLAYIVEGLRPLAVPVDSLKPDPRNARKHDERNVQAVANSLARFGQRKPIVVNKLTGTIEAGNGTLEAAKKLGWTQIAVVWVEDDPTTQTGFALADNRTAELATWDDDVLLELATEVREADGGLFEDLLIEELLADDAAAEAEGEARSAEISESYQVIVQCSDEAHQRRVYDELIKEGLACKVLTL